MDWLDDGGLTLIWWNRLIEAGQKLLAPDEVRERLDRNLKDHRLRVSQMVSEFDGINSSFKTAGIAYAVLKGFALTPEYCSEVCLRTSYDYDYLVDPELVSPAEQALKSIGFVRKQGTEDHPIVYFHRDRPPQRPLSRNDLYTAEFPRTIEVHYRFWDPDMLKIPLVLPIDLLSRREARELSSRAGSGSSIRYYALSREDELIFQVLHVFRHILRNWCRLCSLLDIAHFLECNAADSDFWNRFLAQIDRKQSLTDIVGVVFLLAATVFGATIPDPVLAQVIAKLRPPLTLWVERYGRDSALSNFSNNKFSLFLHREFIDDKACWRQIRRTRLFPVPRPNGVFRATDGTTLEHLKAGSKQLIYIIRRMNHHLTGTIQYGLEAPFWGRARRQTKGNLPG